MFDPPQCAASWRSIGGIELFLHRRPNLGRIPVLLLHGASARHETFTLPRPFGGVARSLVDWLHDRGFDPWLLDWRGSARVVDEARDSGLLSAARQSLDLDSAAAFDLPEALARVRATTSSEGVADSVLGIVGHCMGAAVVAQAIAQGTLDMDLRRLHVVLLTLGLFYEAPAESQLRSQDPLLERLLGSATPPSVIDPREGATWPAELGELYASLRSGTDHRDHSSGTISAAEALCDRVSFLYGRPYLERNLFATVHRDSLVIEFRDGVRAPSAGDRIYGAMSGARARVLEVIAGAGTWERGDRAGTLLGSPEAEGFRAGEALVLGGRKVATCLAAESLAAELPAQFGAIPLRLYTHAWRNLRRGWAAAFDARDEDRALVGRTAHARFCGLGRLLLLTGERNSLWHRRSIDRMHDWLVRGPGCRALPVSLRVLRGYGHQDLLWGRAARQDVFPSIEATLRP